MDYKDLYTRAIMQELGQEQTEELVRKNLINWWTNLRQRGKSGLRLTDEGLRSIKFSGLSIYEVKYPEKMLMTSQVFLFMDKYLDCPYYLKNDSILVMDSKRAIELTLYSGDIKKYGEAHSRNRTKKFREVRDLRLRILTSCSAKNDFINYYREKTGLRWQG